MNGSSVRKGLEIFAAAAALSATGCTKDEPKPEPAPAASSLAPSVAPKAARSYTLSLDPKGKASIDMEAPKEHIKGQTSIVEGRVDVDPSNLSATRGEVKVDLTSLVLSTFGDASKDGTQTAHAKTWLEVADAENAKLADDVKAKNRMAVFAIRSVDGLAENDLSKVAPVSAAGEDARTVDLVAHGELLVHGRKVPKDAALRVRFVHPAGRVATERPTLVTVATREPFKVTLAEHEVAPRDDVGQIAKKAFSILGTKVAETAKVTLDLSGRPSP